MQYAHWLMVAGAVLVVLGFICFALHKNDAGTAEGHLTRDTSSETVQAALAAIESERGRALDRLSGRSNTRIFRLRFLVACLDEASSVFHSRSLDKFI